MKHGLLLLLLCATYSVAVVIQAAGTAFPAVPERNPSSATSALLERFELRYGSAHTLETTFLERYLENGRLVRAEAGKAYFLHPGRMRWDYESPEKNLFLADGKYVWFYSPADHTATRTPAKQSEDWRTPLALLTSHVKLSRICSQLGPAPAAKPSQPTNAVFSCILRNSTADSASHPVLFELSPDSELSRLIVPQEGGIQLEFSFTNWQWNPVLDKSLFQFTPPPHAVIVNAPLPDTPGLRQ
jgi:outer membrane lipoprotein carrier protein